MSGYVGSRGGSSLVSINNVDDVTVNGLSQKSTTDKPIFVPEGENQVYFGDTTFTGQVRVKGSMIVVNGTPDFLGDVDIEGNLYVG
jgi:hypothetical protein